MVAVPAVLAGFTQLAPSVVRLAASASMMLDCFMKTVIRLGDSPLASFVIGAQTRRAGEKQESGERTYPPALFSPAQMPWIEVLSPSRSPLL
jgi:hypothetical protein